MRKRHLPFRGPVGFTPAESRVAAGLAIIALAASGIALYQRLTHPAPRLVTEVVTLTAEREAASPKLDAAKEVDEAVRPATPMTVIDLNSADYADLERLPGIGPTLAARIIAYREREGPFPTVDGLLAVPGIGKKKLEALRPYLRVGKR